MSRHKWLVFERAATAPPHGLTGLAQPPSGGIRDVGFAYGHSPGGDDMNCGCNGSYRVQRRYHDRDRDKPRPVGCAMRAPHVIQPDLGQSAALSISTAGTAEIPLPHCILPLNWNPVSMLASGYPCLPVHIRAAHPPTSTHWSCPAENQACVEADRISRRQFRTPAARGACRIVLVAGRGPTLIRQPGPAVQPRHFRGPASYSIAVAETASRQRASHAGG